MRTAWPGRPNASILAFLMMHCALVVAGSSAVLGQSLRQTPPIPQNNFSGPSIGNPNQGFNPPNAARTNSAPQGNNLGGNNGQSGTRVASLQNGQGSNGYGPQNGSTLGQGNPAQGSLSGSQASAGPDSATTKIATRNLLQIFHDGGWMMYPIALCSFVWTVFAFERFVYLRAGRIIPRPFVRRLIEQLQQQQIEKDEALELCERNASPFALILTAAVKKYGKPAVEIEQSILDAGERVTFLLRRHLRLLNSISNVAPLLGLLGTVLGMIEAFNGLATADSSTRSQLLAGGIGHAMLTTAAGLMVAIPAYLSYMYYLGRTDRLLMEMDEYAQQVVEAISAEGLSESEYGKGRGRARRNAA